MSWLEMLCSDTYRGRWVALDNVRYDSATSRPLEGDVVDVDEDLAELCSRMRQADHCSCAVLFCDGQSNAMPVVRRPSQPPVGSPQQRRA